ncbi:MAG: Lrp/AsnC family transcriptional regulator [Nanoarchaeota archaeon]|nr:Lrp/AsnC family transcriptional regulator [Nanoarchaeota archaeon]
MYKIDKKDRKIIYYLSNNARLTHNQIGKRVGLSKNTVNYKIKRLKELGIIKSFASIINLSTLGYTTITLLLRFNEDVYENIEILNYFKEHGSVDWMVTLSGKWDLFVEFIISDFIHLENIVQEILEKFEGTIERYELFFSKETLKVEHLIEDFYKDLKLDPLPSAKRINVISKINTMDKNILSLISTNSSMNYTQIAQKLNTSIDVVRYSIQKMIKNNVIIKVFSEIDLNKLGYTEYLSQIKLRNFNKEKYNQLKIYLKNHPNITYAFVDVSNFCIIFVCAFKDSENIDTLLRYLRKNYGVIIQEQEYLIIKEQIIFNLFPKGLLKL